MLSLVLHSHVMAGLPDAAQAGELTPEAFAERAIRMLAARYGVLIPEVPPAPVRPFTQPVQPVKSTGGRKRKAATWPMDRDVPGGPFALVCPWCGRKFHTDDERMGPNAIAYCSEKCKVAAENRRNYQRRKKPP